MLCCYTQPADAVTDAMPGVAVPSAVVHHILNPQAWQHLGVVADPMPGAHEQGSAGGGQVCGHWAAVHW